MFPIRLPLLIQNRTAPEASDGKSPESNMRQLHRQICTLTSLLVLVFTCSTSQAAKTGAQKPAASKSAPAEMQTLRQAYSLLSSADHDYQGHRARAMKLIEAACRALGSSVKGDGEGDEPQTQSDSQVQQALSLLQSVESSVATNNARAAKHLTRAIKELNAALSVN
jgi:cell pole-organizing protein PopZ